MTDERTKLDSEKFCFFSAGGATSCIWLPAESMFGNILSNVSDTDYCSHYENYRVAFIWVKYDEIAQFASSKSGQSDLDVLFREINRGSLE